MSLKNGGINGAPTENGAKENGDDNLKSQGDEEQRGETEMMEKNDFQILEADLNEHVPEDIPIQEVLAFFSKSKYSASSKDLLVQTAMSKCIDLIKKDYDITIIDNTNGVLCEYYPYQIPLYLSEKGYCSPIYEDSTSSEALELLIQKARRARCRERFPAPVIFFKGKFICRSSTLSLSLEVMARTAMDYLTLTQNPQNERRAKEIDELLSSQATTSEQPKTVCTDLQTADITLLQQLNVGAIVDLMVENKKHKVGIAFSSSEKADKDEPNNRYSSLFNLISLPYPGCEFFEDFFKKHYIAEGLHFDWTQAMCDAPLTVPEKPSLDYLDINWSEYKDWDLVKITKNYIKYILKYIQDSDSGVLVHCISGWDRTPLFISLIRLSLWADGLIHQSLTEHEILYLTVAYDWMLFGHQLKTRLHYQEEILLFCFHFLKYIISDEFSVVPPRSRSRKSEDPSLDKNPSDTSIPNVKISEQLNKSEENAEEDAMESARVKKRKHTTSGCENEEKIETLLMAVHGEESNESVCEFTDEMDQGSGSQPYDPNESLSRTSPISIPSRQRSPQEVLAGSVDSWVQVSSTGSLRGSDDFDMRLPSRSSMSPSVLSRKDKLLKVRTLFYRSYYKTVSNVQYRTNTGVLTGLINSMREKAASFMASNPIQEPSETADK